ncbi:FkbM family methyltransferase [Teredinibacter sp. KSP-S5-2]|uniref:FkbM family methyltransferase n=1 Tax=Teredinibacter sp. KSP-S5-2 TaxID=3034506 RepID=UPI0029346DA5|nr:FkbM family methyltransferase [Teredinibacter sp. KSP-S5-2]WNO07857.1 FkbM family methyltransferase [Teredinibacter sp. KSP-S5-2]
MRKILAKRLLANSKLSVVDVGCAFGPSHKFNKVLEYVDFVGFDPFSDNSRLEWKGKEKLNSVRIVETALWREESRQPFYVTSKSACSSLLMPNESIVNELGMGKQFKIEKTLDVNTQRLDQVCSSYDFLKVDVQGGALEVLQGAEETLSSALVIEVESEFYELYKNQPKVGDVVAWLKERSFWLISFCDLKHLPASGGSFKSLAYGDLLFLNKKKLADGEINSLKKAMMLGIIVNSPELVLIAADRYREVHSDTPLDASVRFYLSWLAMKEKLIRYAKLL